MAAFEKQVDSVDKHEKHNENKIVELIPIDKLNVIKKVRGQFLLLIYVKV